MTLILALANMEWSILISDRRCSYDGIVVDGDLNKTASLTLKGARLMYAFTGLAKAEGFATSEWIARSIVDCAPPDYEPVNILQRLADLATDTFRMHGALFKLEKKRKLLTILFSGYLDDQRPIGLAEISNRSESSPYLASDTFRCRFLQYPSAGHTASIVTFGAGATSAMRPTDWDHLSRLAEPEMPPRAAIFSTVKLMRKIARRPSARGTIGDDMMSIATYRSVLEVSSLFHSATSRNSVFLPTYVVATPTRRIAVTGIGLSVKEHSLSGPIPSKSQPCSCGSGKKQRKCCSRQFMKAMRKREGRLASQTENASIAPSQ